MNNQINLEHKIREILDGEGSAADKIQAIYDDLLPGPLPDPLFGARATHPECGEGIVGSSRPNVDGTVWFMFPDEATGDGTCSRWVHSSDLTFHTPETHPEFLETEVDYHSVISRLRRQVSRLGPEA